MGIRSPRAGSRARRSDRALAIIAARAPPPTVNSHDECCGWWDASRPVAWRPTGTWRRGRTARCGAGRRQHHADGANDPACPITGSWPPEDESGDTGRAPTESRPAQRGGAGHGRHRIRDFAHRSALRPRHTPETEAPRQREAPMTPSKRMTSVAAGHADMALAERCRHDEPDAFEELYRLHAPRLFGLAYRLVGAAKRRICCRRSSWPRTGRWRSTGASRRSAPGCSGWP